MQDHRCGELGPMTLAQNYYRGRTYAEDKKIPRRDGLVAFYYIARFRLFN